MKNKDIIFWGSLLFAGALIAATGLAVEIASQRVKRRLRKRR